MQSKQDGVLQKQKQKQRQKQAQKHDWGNAVSASWNWVQRSLVALPIFIVLLGIFIGVSNLTKIEWDNNPTDQTIQTIGNRTEVTFNNTTGTALPTRGTYETKKISRYITITQPSTGETQRAHILIRVPVDSQGRRVQGSDIGLKNGLPGVVFLHGAGYGSAANSFADVATDLTSAGMVTVTIDKPVWSTSDINRDYKASARAYDKAAQYLRKLSYVDSSKVGVYATSESTWITPYMIKYDKKIAFQILLSPMVYVPRHSLGFFVAQDFAIVGANPGYQSIVRRVFSFDTGMLGLDNLDFNSLLENSYSIPTFVAYGSKDVMTAQVGGISTIEGMAHKVGNWNVTVRNYPIGNHVLRLGDEALPGTTLVDHYEDDIASWAVGTMRGLKQTSSLVAGANIQQSIAVPTQLKAHRALTIYAVVIHAGMILLLLASLVMGIYAVVTKIRRKIRGDARPVFGFLGRNQRYLMRISFTTLAALLLFVAGLGQIIYRMVKLIWGAAPVAPGMIYWSWYVVQAACFVVLWSWSTVFARLFEVLIKQIQHAYTVHHSADKFTMSVLMDVRKELGKRSIIATTHFGQVFFIITTAAMFAVLLFFAFWGLFVY